MSRRAAVCAMDLIHGRGFLNRLHKSGNLSPPFSLFSSNFRSERAFSRNVPTIDFSRVKELDDAVQLFHEMKMEPELSFKVYNKLMSVSVKIEQYSFALNVFDEMLRMGLPFDVYSMNIAINCCCLLKDIDSAFALMGFFLKRSYEPDVVTFSTLIRGLFLEDKVADAVKLFGKVMDLKLCEPNDVMILHVMHGLCKAGLVVSAHDWLCRLESSGWRPNVYAYSALIDGLCKCGMVDDALQLLSKMIENGIKPDIVTYNSVIKGLCDSGRLKDVKDLLAEMANSKISLDVITFTILIDSYFKEGMMEEVGMVLETMAQKNIRPCVITYNALINGLCLKGEISKAKQLIDSMVGRGLVEPDIVSYNSLINGYCKNGSMDEAWFLFHEIPSRGLQRDASTYNTMIHGLFSKGRFAEGCKLFEDMEAQQVLPDLHTYSILLDGLCMNGEIDEALSLLRAIEVKGFTPNIVMYGSIIYGLLKIGKRDVARDVFNQLSSIDQANVKTYTMIIHSLCQEGSWEEVQHLLVEMENRGCGPNRVTYHVIIQSLLKQKEFHKAASFIEEMREKGFLSTSSVPTDQVEEHIGDDFFLKLMKDLAPKEIAS